jgi:type IV secretory pathway VirB10-like protein
MPNIIDDLKSSGPSSPSVASPIGSNGLRGKVTGVTRIGARAGIIAMVGLGGLIAAIFFGISSSASHAYRSVTASTAPQVLSTDAPLIDNIPGAVPTATPAGYHAPSSRSTSVAGNTATVVRSAPGQQPIALPAQQPVEAPQQQQQPNASMQQQGQQQQMMNAAMLAQAQEQLLAQAQAASLGAQRPVNAAPTHAQLVADRERNARTSAILVTGPGGAPSASPAPATPYVLQQGSVIPATLITGINSDLPGAAVAQVDQNVYDSQSGQYLLIPRGSKLIGNFASGVVLGQSRVMVDWQRILYPNGSSVDISGAEGSDAAGYTGFTGKVDTHQNILKTALTSLITIGTAIASQPRVVLAAPVAGTTVVMSPTVGQQAEVTAAQQLQQNVSQVANANGQQRPTIEVRPGYIFNVMVAHDLVLAAPYDN